MEADFASTNGNGRVRAVPVPTGRERGVLLTEPFFTLHGEIIPESDPSVRDLERMLRVDGMAHALERGITLPILASHHYITEADGDRGEAELARENLLSPGGVNMDKLLSHMTGAISRRASFFELEWAKSGNRVMYNKIAYRPATSCAPLVDLSDGSFNGFLQRGTTPKGLPFEVQIQPERAFVYFHDEANAPMRGRSAFETVYQDFLDKQKVKRLYYYHLQNLSLGSVVTRYQGGDPNGSQKLAKKAAGLRGGGVIGLDRGEEVETFEFGKGESGFKEGLEWLNSQMGVSLLAGFLNLGQRGDTGSWALSRDQSDFFLQSLEAKQAEMSAAITEHLIRPLITYNFGPDAAMPRFEFEGLSTTEKNKALEVWQAIITSPAAQVVRPEVLDAIEENAMPMLGVDPEKLTGSGVQTPTEPSGADLEESERQLEGLEAEGGSGG